MIDNKAGRKNPRDIIFYAGVSKEEFEKIQPIFNHMNYNVWKKMMGNLFPLVLVAFIVCLLVPQYKADVPILAVYLIVWIYNFVILSKIPDVSNYYKYHYLSLFSILLVTSIIGSCINHPDFPLFFYFVIFVTFISSQFNQPIKIVPIIFISSILMAVLMFVFGSKEAFVPNLIFLLMGTVYLFNFNVNISISKIVSLNNATMQVESLYEEKLKSHRHISALAGLSKEYGTILYADLIDNVVMNVYAAEMSEYGENTIGKKMSDVIQKYCDDKVYVEDSSYVKSMLSVENIKAKLDNHETVSSRYRINDNGQELYYEMKVIRDEEGDGKYPIIIATKNVDVEVRLDMVFKANYDEAKQNATKDIMTGVKNKTAYEWKVQELEKEMQIEDKFEMAVVMVDVNGLKKVNDTLGHDEGDKLIKGVCSLISENYKRSPIYRVGGDEFVVLLQGNDYYNRDILLENARKLAKENEHNVSYACGMAVYDKNIDDGVLSVYKRADSLMYENKKKMKAVRVD